MKLEDQVVSLELAKKMKELGFPQHSSFYWQRSWHDKPYKFNPGGSWETADQDGRISAYTVAELGDLLPDYIPNLGNLFISFAKTDHTNLEKHEKPWVNISFWYWSVPKNYKAGQELKWETHHLVQAESEADARAQMLIYLKENGLLEEDNG